MDQSSTLNSNLQALNDLLIRERVAITNLQMDNLEAVQQEKIGLLKRMQQAEKTPDEKSIGLIDMIRVNNERNRFLLRSGLTMIGKLQDNVFRLLALTYAPHGALNIDPGPRILNRNA
jgi:hypothetical protein